MKTPPTRYTKSGDLNIAYQVVGDGPFDLVYVPGWISNIEMMWTEPSYARLLGRLASFSRVLLFDKRGTGLSDRVSNDHLPTLEQRMDDVRAVMDAAHSERAALFGHSEGCSMSVLFAATYPDRSIALALYGGFAKRFRSDDYPWAPTMDERLSLADEIERGWGDVDLNYYVPSRAGDDSVREWLSAYFRSGASPAAAAALLRMNSRNDIRAVLPAVRVPTLVMHASGDRDVKFEEGQYVAGHIAGARFLEIAGGDHIWYLSPKADEIVDAIEEFFTGVRPMPEPDRFLATVLFTDVVDGTARAAELGDRRWRDLVERHHSMVRRELSRHRGAEVDTAGDGFFATFDAPGRAVRCAMAIRNGVRELGLEIRAGVHTGECQVIAGKTGGIATIVGARVREQATPGEVLVTSTVRDLTSGAGIVFEDRGSRMLKGVPREWQLFAAS
ncbi:MAG: adenylate/guanylate cyclase domain-containing protein [Chloroflexi bacterium]|nr:MAG: adenylate/guanylate cyclase domain-containing protein [Chloroflexota bacterium]